MLLLLPIHREIIEGRGTSNNAVILDLSEVDEKALQQVSGKFIRSAKAAGFDFENDNIEVAPAAHYMMGGVEIDENAFAGIPGLFAAGEVAAGLHGATYLHGNGLTEATVFGKIAGVNAANYVTNPVSFTKYIKLIIKIVK